MEASAQARHLRFRFDGYEVDRLREIIAGGELEHSILGKSTCSLEVRHWSDGHFQLDYGKYSFATVVRGQFPKGRICIGMVPQMRIPTWINGYEVRTGHLQVYSEDAELFYRAGPEVAWCAATFDRQELQQVALAHMGRPLNLPRSGVVNIAPDPGAFASLERLARMSLMQIEGQPGASRQPKEQLTISYVEALASADPDSAGKLRARAEYRADLVRRADRYLRAAIGERYSSEKLCRFLGMSERNLQLHFRAALGMSPQKWAQGLALDAAHDVLKCSGELKGIVAKVALQHGFDHFGRFARSYRDRFGVSPSATLRRVSREGVHRSERLV